MTLTSPITRFPNMNMILKILYENESFNKEKSLDKQFLADKMNKSTAIVNNALSMLRDMKLVSGGHRFRDKKVFLLDDGIKFYELLKTNDKDKICDFSIKLIKKSKSLLLKESYTLLKREPQIAHGKLGELIREKLNINKKPLSKTTYTNIGRSIKDVFCEMRIIDSDEAKLRRRNIRTRFTTKLYAKQRMPNILRTIRNFDNENTWEIDIPVDFETARMNAREIARTLFDLNIAYYSDDENNVLKLTEVGIRLKNNLNNDDKRKEILRSILLDYKPIKIIIQKIIDLDKDFTSIDIGYMINDFNKKQWKPRTKMGHGIALVSWLKEAGIIEDSETQFRYRLSKDFEINILDKKKMIDWSLIDDKQFEFLCCDLLESLDNFENVSRMGGPGDLKRDITATERIKSTFGVEYFKWLVQCKHYGKTKINPSEIPELINAISTHGAKGLLLITCSELTPSLKIHLEKYNDNPSIPYKVHWIEKNKLEELLKSNEKIKNKYF